MRSWIPAICLVLALVGSGARAEEASVFFLTPTTGPVGEVAGALLQQMAGLGMTGQAVTALPESLPEKGVVVTDDDHLTSAVTCRQLQAWVRAGGGLVLLVEPSETHYSQATQFLGQMGATVSALPADRENALVFGESPVTNGLTPANPVSARMKITGEGVRALATAGGEPAIAQLEVGKGGVIVFPASLLVAAVRQNPPDGALLTMGLRAIYWVSQAPEAAPAEEPVASETPATPPAAGGTTPTTPPAPRPQKVPGLPTLAPTSLPLEARDFAGVTLYDCRAADDHWPQISDAVQAILKEQGLVAKALEVKPGEPSLVAALQSEPKLAVLATWRPLTEGETVAVYYYLLGGGRIMALGNAATGTQVRLTYLNAALNPLGLVFALGRPSGATVFPASFLSETVKGPANLPAGIQVTGDGATPVIKVGGATAFAAIRRGRGRLIALDAGPLVDNAEYREDLKEGLKWLLSPEN